jgi:hypothetical protein
MGSTVMGTPRAYGAAGRTRIRVVAQFEIPGGPIPSFLILGTLLLAVAVDGGVSLA